MTIRRPRFRYQAICRTRVSPPPTAWSPNWSTQEQVWRLTSQATTWPVSVQVIVLAGTLVSAGDLPTCSKKPD